MGILIIIIITNTTNNKKMKVFSSFILIFLCLIQYGKTHTIPFEKQQLGDLIIKRMGMLASEDPTADKPDSFIQLVLDLERESDQGEQVIEVFVSHMDSLDSFAANNEVQCCQTECTPGHVVFNKQAGRDVTHVPATFKDGEFSIKFTPEKIIPSKDGIYYVYIINCREEPTKVTIDGHILFKNPFGFLSADAYSTLYFYGIMSLLYLCLAIGWLILSALYWRKLLNIQFWIALVIGMGMLVCSLWYFDYLNQNSTGNPDIGFTLFAILMSAAKETVSYVLVLILCMGYGVVKPSLGSTRYKVFLLGGLFFIFEASLEMNDSVARSSSSENVGVSLAFPVMLILTIFYWWIFLSLFKTIGQVTLRGQNLKKGMYQTLLAALFIAGVIAVLVIAYQLIIIMIDAQDEHWRSYWMWQAFGPFLKFCLLVIIAFVWRPTANNTRYSYSEGDHLRDVEVPLTAVAPGKKPGGGRMSRRSRRERGSSKKDKNEDERDMNLMEMSAAISQFSLDDGDDENEISKLQ